VEVLWSHRVEGDAFRRLVIESDRALVSTGRQTLVVSRGGDVLDRHEPPLLGRNDSGSLILLGENRYELADGCLVEFDTDGSQNQRAEIPIDQFERYRDCFARAFAEWTPVAAEWTDHQIRKWWRSAGLLPDPARGRLLAFGGNTPWLVTLRTDGGVEWVLLIGAVTDCCNGVEVVAGDGTLAHFSSCGRRVTFVTTGGQIVSAHDVDGLPSHLLTNGRGVAYVTLIGRGIAEYRPLVGFTRTVEIPGLQQARIKERILYAVVDDLPDGFLLKAIREPT
jgi:hypothetical protein